MPEVPCEQCGQPVLDTAEKCPQCGQLQPEIMFQAGVPHQVCSACQVKNYVYHETCRHCRAPLAVPVSPMEILEQRMDVVGEIQYRAKQAATLGVIVFVLAGFATGQIQHHAHGDGMSLLVITVILGFVGGLVGWFFGFAAWAGYHFFKPWRRPGPR